MNKTPKEILEELSLKFNKNMASWAKSDHQSLSRTFLFARAITEIGQVLKKPNLPKHQQRCCAIFDEIFSDTISAVYLATCAIDKPANIVMRRVLELGIAALYLWDMPHVMYAWEYHGQDLSFTEMINHINSAGYRQYVSEELGKTVENDIVESTILKDHYGRLSDVVHGRISSFESNLPERFTFNENDWKSFVAMANEILEALLKSYFNRFKVSAEIFKKIPGLNKP